MKKTIFYILIIMLILTNSYSQERLTDMDVYDFIVSNCSGDRTEHSIRKGVFVKQPLTAYDMFGNKNLIDLIDKQIIQQPVMSMKFAYKDSEDVILNMDQILHNIILTHPIDPSKFNRCPIASNLSENDIVSMKQQILHNKLKIWEIDKMKCFIKNDSILNTEETENILKSGIDTSDQLSENYVLHKMSIPIFSANKKICILFNYFIDNNNFRKSEIRSMEIFEKNKYNNWLLVGKNWF